MLNIKAQRLKCYRNKKACTSYIEFKLTQLINGNLYFSLYFTTNGK